MPFEKHDQVSEKRSKNTDFGAGNLVETSDAENHSDLGVLPENFPKKQQNYGIEVVKNMVFQPILSQSKIGVQLWIDMQNTKNYGLEPISSS